MKDRTAFIIGGTGGLGQAIVSAMAEDWGTLVVGYRSNRAVAEEVAARTGPNARAVHCDLTQADSVATAFKDIESGGDPLGAVIFAGGVAIAQPFVSQIGEADWQAVIETEMMGFARTVSAAIPPLRKNGGGALVAISSVANYCYPPGDALSAVPKAAIESLCRAVAREEGRYQIRANAVAPGIIDAGLGAAFLKDLYDPEIWDAQRRRVALRRFGQAREIAEAVAFLASDKASYISGQTLVVDGGFSI